MKPKSIKYISPCFDNSGYAKAARANIVALHKLGVPITVSPISFENIKPNLGEDGKIIESLVNKDIDYDVVLCHTTPEFWAQNKEPGKLFAGFTIWETDKLHPDWPKYINETADVCMVGCDWNVEVFKNSGVTVPLYSVPHCTSLNDFKFVPPMKINGIRDSTFVFYNICQFTERKDPPSVLKAYWSAFRGGEDVALVLKTYRSDYSEPEKEAIRTTIRRLKAVCPSDSYPPIYLLLNMLSEDEISALHVRGDCYVSLDRGEGFGLTGFQAAAQGHPIIVTGYGGALEYAKPEHSYLVDYIEVPCWGMPWSPWYRLEQNWAQASPTHGAKLMREVYENQEEAKKKGLAAKKYVEDNFSWKVIGQKIIDVVRSL